MIPQFECLRPWHRSPYNRGFYACTYLSAHINITYLCAHTILHRINQKALWNPYFLGRGYISGGPVEQPWSHELRLCRTTKLADGTADQPLHSFLPSAFCCHTICHLAVFFSLLLLGKVTMISPSLVDPCSFFSSFVSNRCDRLSQRQLLILWWQILKWALWY